MNDTFLVLPWMWEFRLALLLAVILCLLWLWIYAPDFWKRTGVRFIIVILGVSLFFGWLTFCRENHRTPTWINK